MGINPRSFLFPLFPLLFPLFLFVPLLLTSPASSSVYDEWFFNCQDSFECDSIPTKYFPLWRYNGAETCNSGRPYNESMTLKCDRSPGAIEIVGANYELLGFSMNDQILIIAEIGFSDRFCSPGNNSLSTSIYAIIPVSYDCQNPQSEKPTCSGNEFRYMPFQNLAPPNPEGYYCWLSLVVPIPQSLVEEVGDDWQNVSQHIIAEFRKPDRKVDGQVCSQCKERGGVYFYDLQLGQTSCCCQFSFVRIESCLSLSVTQSPNYADEPKTALHSDDSKSKKEKVKPLIIGVSIGGACLVATIIGCCIFLCFRKKKKQYPIGSVSKEAGPSPHISDSISNKDLPPAPLLNSFQSQSIPSYPSSKSDIETPTTTNHGIRVFNYAELETATDNFDRSRELGDGGFGTVYYGKLVDGREVAVKRLYEHNCKRVEQFMNEVDILAHLQHNNLVKLYGCTSRYSQGLLLVYEYIPNGTVADHLHGSRMKLGLLSWPIRLRIAIETANALMYLHHSEIIHRDVKTTNILLDNNFTVKVADFGLSRLFPNNVTHVSTAPQGTPGYVDPEYYQCYQLTTKSDVYSFGVVLIELISSLRAVDTDRTRHDINLSNMAVSKIRGRALDELVDPKLGFNENHEVRSATTSVAKLAFLCLQQERDLRPTMDEVVEILRKIENDKSSSEMAKVIDIGVVGNDIELIKKASSSFSPNSVIANNWVDSSTTTNSL